MAKKIFNIVLTVIMILLVIFVAFMFFARITGESPSIFGYHVYRVLTGSMEPELNVGDVILIREVSSEDIEKGDIITFKAAKGEMTGQYVTHRVVTEPELKGGRLFIQTQGDAIGAPLDPVITFDQVEGKFVSKLPFLNKIYAFFVTPYGLIAFIVLIMVMFGYEIISLILSYRSFDKKADEYISSHSEDDDDTSASGDDNTASAADNTEE